MSRASARVIAAAVVLVLAMGSGLAAAAPAARVTRDSACTMVTAKQVEKAFGGPVAEGVEQSVVLSCTYLVGTDPNTAPGGSFATQQLFPSILNTTKTAKAAIEDAHAIDLIAEDDLRDVDGVGKSAYIDQTQGRIVVQANKKFTFILIWSPASKITRIGKKAEKQLIKLAKNIVKRAPR